MVTATQSTTILEGSGIFAQPSSLPFQAPDFARINDADFKPAIEQGMAIERAEWAAIGANPAPATFDNTIVALEKAGRMLDRARAVFSVKTGTVTNDTLDAIDAELSPRLAAHNDALYLDDAIFQRVEAVYNARDTFDLTAEDRVLLQRTYDDFVHAGARLSPDAKVQLREINTALSSLSTKFSQVLTEADRQQALVVADRAALAGLSEAEIAAAAQAAQERGLNGKEIITLQNTTQQPKLNALTNRDTRRELFEKSWNRTSDGSANDTRDMVRQIASLRARKAALFGEPDFASYEMYDRMARDPQTAIEFMKGLAGPTAAAQLREAAAINDEIAAEGKNFPVEPYDWDFYAEKVRAKKFDLDAGLIKPYFQVDRVLEDGVFFAANKLYGLTFEKRDDIPTWHPTVSVYTVFDKDGSELALFYFDPFRRDNKRGGAWMSSFVSQSHLYGEKPVIYNVLNIAQPAEGEPALATFDDVTTMFHEFGHALHGLFADQKYPSLSGTAVARDFVEYPSQANEKWAVEPTVLANYARHYQTGEPMPADLLAKVRESQTFNQGYALGETLAAAMLDMDWHTLPDGKVPEDVNGFEAAALAANPLHTDIVPPRYRSTYFRHIWSGGYSAGYYAYLWTEMLSADTGEWFDEHGGMTRANGDRFRETVLSRGGTVDYGEAFRAMTGNDPEVEPMLRQRGLLDEAN
ncbi:M3 family metallopeptidase [Croceicoccus sediminis]|uniref:M3 family metallopeptidase n=1 Tax=Croceicoccus sediminis TaxID=2571150 RepID=UPI001181F912|nr:M3 family metallopeptidase [Croceicoccus sediminis]